jgi:hypothetical protein
VFPVARHVDAAETPQMRAVQARLVSFLSEQRTYLASERTIFRRLLDCARVFCGEIKNPGLSKKIHPKLLTVPSNAACTTPTK